MLTRDLAKGLFTRGEEHGDHGAEGKAGPPSDDVVPEGAPSAQGGRPVPPRAPRSVDEGASSPREAAFHHRSEVSATPCRLHATLRRSATDSRPLHPPALLLLVLGPSANEAFRASETPLFNFGILHLNSFLGGENAAPSKHEVRGGADRRYRRTARQAMDCEEHSGRQ